MCRQKCLPGSSLHNPIISCASDNRQSFSSHSRSFMERLENSHGQITRPARPRQAGLRPHIPPGWNLPGRAGRPGWVSGGRLAPDGRGMFPKGKGRSRSRSPRGAILAWLAPPYTLHMTLVMAAAAFLAKLAADLRRDAWSKAKKMFVSNCFRPRDGRALAPLPGQGRVGYRH